MPHSRRSHHDMSTRVLPKPEHLKTTSQDTTQARASTQDHSDLDIESQLALQSLMNQRKARFKRRMITGGVILGLLLIVGLLSQLGHLLSLGVSSESSLHVARVERGTYEEFIEVVGNLKPLNAQTITPETDGIIKTVHVADGQVVAEGDLLLTIQNDQLDQAVKEANFSVKSATQELEQAKSTLAQAQTALNENQEPSVAGELKRARDAARMQVDAATLAVERTKAALAQAESLAKKRSVVAPCAGTIVSLTAEAGKSLAQSAQAGSGALIQIADLSQMVVHVEVNEFDISKIQIGQTAELTFPALKDVKVKATVNKISAVPASQTQNPYGAMSAQSEQARYQVELLLTESHPHLKPGMTSVGKVLFVQESDVLMVPTSTIAHDDQGDYVYVVTNKEQRTYERRAVTTSHKDFVRTVITSGLSEGDEVLLYPEEQPDTASHTA